MENVDLIRRYALKKINELRIFVSMLSPREEMALQRLHGPDGVKTAATIADHILLQLGHCPPNPANESSQTIRDARKVMPDRAANRPKRSKLVETTDGEA